MSAAHRRDKISRGWGGDTPPIPVTKIDAELYGALREVEGDQLTLQDGRIHMKGFTLTSTGLEIGQEVDEEGWKQMGEMLFRLEGSIQWLIGDWLIYGVDLKYGDIDQIAAALGREPKTLYNYAYYSRQIESSLRREDLSYNHHALVAKKSADFQQYALAYAAESKLSVSAFRTWLKEQDQDETPALSSGQLPPLKAVSGEIDKMARMDPDKAKPEQHEKAYTLYLEARQSLEAFARKWGFE